VTCQICGNEVEFPIKPKVKHEWKEGDLCKKCKTPVVFKKSKWKPSKEKKTYYYTGYLECPRCKTFYMSDRFKVVKNPEVIGEWQIKNGKRFLRINNQLVEMGLYRHPIKGYLKIVLIQEANFITQHD
jgi:RNase P subunit RPR2